MDYNEYISQFKDVLGKVVVTDEKGAALDTQDALESTCALLSSVSEKGSTIYLIGNGGSSGIISHTAIDFVNACKLKAYPITDNSMLTCFANDYGYENVFKEPLQTMIGKDDILLAVSSSGNSPNIVNGATIAKEKGAKVITLSGFKPDNKLRKEGHFNVWLESNSYGYVEIGHALVIHYMVDILAGNI